MSVGVGMSLADIVGKGMEDITRSDGQSVSPLIRAGLAFGMADSLNQQAFAGAVASFAGSLTPDDSSGLDMSPTSKPFGFQ